MLISWELINSEDIRENLKSGKIEISLPLSCFTPPFRLDLHYFLSVQLATQPAQNSRANETEPIARISVGVRLASKLIKSESSILKLSSSHRSKFQVGFFESDTDSCTVSLGNSSRLQNPWITNEPGKPKPAACGCSSCSLPGGSVDIIDNSKHEKHSTDAAIV